MHAYATGPFLPSFGTRPGPRSTPGATVEYLRGLVQKLIITPTICRPYMMAVVGCGRRSHWFHAIIVPRVERTRSFSSPS
ncbi:hypothetical protein BGW80DRAFT_1331024, partial [Lactifluus volemus]